MSSCACARFEAATLQVCLPRSALPPQASLACFGKVERVGAPAAHALENGHRRRESVGDGCLRGCTQHKNVGASASAESPSFPRAARELDFRIISHFLVFLRRVTQDRRSREKGDGGDL